MGKVVVMVFWGRPIQYIIPILMVGVVVARYGVVLVDGLI